MQKILLDTDIGYDIDDATCLAYLLAQPQCDLIGITTVCDGAYERAKVASAICTVAGREDIPIFPGSDKPILFERKPKTVPQAAVLGKFKHQTEFSGGQAIEFMRTAIRQNPNEIIIIAIGPLTNIGLLFAVDPEIPSLLKGLVIMGGNFANPVAGIGLFESNTLWDPYSTAMVYQSEVSLHRSIGTNVTEYAFMNKEEVRKTFTHPLLKCALTFAEVWFENSPGITFHDSIAATTLFNNDVCSFIRGYVDIELSSEALRGMTVLKKCGYLPPKHEVASSINGDRFFESYFTVFK